MFQSRIQIDGNVLSFQIITGSQIYVLGTDEVVAGLPPFGSQVPPNRTLVDRNVSFFLSLSDTQVRALDASRNLWAEVAPFTSGGPTNRTQIDGNVVYFQPVPVPTTEPPGTPNRIYAVDTDGKLWFEGPPYGRIPGVEL